MVSKTGLWMGCLAVLGLVAAGAVWAADEAKKDAPKVELSAKAAAAVKEAYPKATIEAIAMRKRGDLDVYKVELKQDTQGIELKVAKDGTILEVELETTPKDLPKAVADVLVKAAEGGTKVEYAKIEIRYEVKGEKMTKLDTPKTIYEVEFEKDGKKDEVQVDADGKVIPAKKKPAPAAKP